MDAINPLLEVDIFNTIVSLFAILFALQSAIKLVDWILERAGIETKWSKKRRNDSAMLLEHDKDLSVIKQEVRGTHEKIDILGRMLVEMQQKSDASERAGLKDRISQRYRIYHERKVWTEMEKESFEGLISDYELHGGKNSFVHSICEPESCTWNIIDD